jgi:hypothetical protein
MIRVRFHLAKGENFRKWQVRHADGSVTYHDPETTTILMRDCYLRNSRKVAERIHGGENKTVCAWVLCRKVHIWTSTPQPTPEETQIAMVRFNPRRYSWMELWRIHDNQLNDAYSRQIQSGCCRRTGD